MQEMHTRFLLHIVFLIQFVFDTFLINTNSLIFFSSLFYKDFFIMPFSDDLLTCEKRERVVFLVFYTKLYCELSSSKELASGLFVSSLTGNTMGVGLSGVGE